MAHCLNAVHLINNNEYNGQQFTTMHKAQCHPWNTFYVCRRMANKVLN
jgi:hypothetical protein